MINNKKCPVCSQQFNTKRSDAKYCSGSCKQKAHHTKSKQPINNEIPQPPKFTHSEYEAVLAILDFSHIDIPFMIYCYYRRLLKGNPTPEEINNYIDSIWMDVSEVESLRSYENFKEEFLTGKYEVVYG